MEFERQLKVTKISPRQFVREISSTARVFEVRTTYRPISNESDTWENESNSPDDLSKVPKRLRWKYRDFFGTRNAERLAPTGLQTMPSN